MIHGLSEVAIRALKPAKLFAYRTRSEVAKNVVLEATSFVDFCLVWLNVQNDTMLLHEKVFGGNFLFGRGVMVTDHATTRREIVRPSMRGNNFMGIKIVASDSNVFATNAAVLNQCPPARDATRAYLDAKIFTKKVHAMGLEDVRADVRGILDEWKDHPKMADYLVLRSAVTRVFLKILANDTVPADEAELVTSAYMRRFVEASLFSGYFPVMLGLLGTYQAIRRDAYFRLKSRGIDLMTIDATLFAAMFSIGTLVIRCVDATRTWGIDYRSLDARRKRNFVYEVIRLQPTVTSVHRKLEAKETVEVAGRPLELDVGDEVVYPFVCSNRDPAVFPRPDELDLERPDEQREAVLSWSGGAHVCPAKDLSVLVTIVMLDALAERFDLSSLEIWSPEF